MKQAVIEVRDAKCPSCRGSTAAKVKDAYACLGCGTKYAVPAVIACGAAARRDPCCTCELQAGHGPTVRHASYRTVLKVWHYFE